MYLVKTKGGIRALDAKPANFEHLTEDAKKKFADEGFLLADQIDVYDKTPVMEIAKAYEWVYISYYTFIKDSSINGKFALAVLEKVKVGPSPILEAIRETKRIFDMIDLANKPKLKWEPLEFPQNHLFDALRYGTAMHYKILGDEKTLSELKPGQVLIKDHEGRYKMADEYFLDRQEKNGRYVDSTLKITDLKEVKVKSKAEVDEETKQSHISFARFFYKHDDSDYNMVYNEWKNK